LSETHIFKIFGSKKPLKRYPYTSSILENDMIVDNPMFMCGWSIYYSMRSLIDVLLWGSFFPYLQEVEKSYNYNYHDYCCNQYY